MAKSLCGLDGRIYTFQMPAGLCEVDLRRPATGAPILDYLLREKRLFFAERTQFLLYWLVDCDWLQQVKAGQRPAGSAMPPHDIMFAVQLLPDASLFNIRNVPHERYFDHISDGWPKDPPPVTVEAGMAEIRRLAAGQPREPTPESGTRIPLGPLPRDDRVLYFGSLDLNLRGGTLRPEAGIYATAVLGDIPLSIYASGPLIDAGSIAGLQDRLRMILQGLFESEDLHGPRPGRDGGGQR